MLWVWGWCPIPESTSSIFRLHLNLVQWSEAQNRRKIKFYSLLHFDLLGSEHWTNWIKRFQPESESAFWAFPKSESRCTQDQTSLMWLVYRRYVFKYCTQFRPYVPRVVRNFQSRRGSEKSRGRRPQNTADPCREVARVGYIRVHPLTGGSGGLPLGKFVKIWLLSMVL